jgi:hypothetical protein
MTTIALPQVQVPSMFQASNLFGRRAVQIVLSLAIALGLTFGLSLTTNAGTASAATGDSAPVKFGLGRAYMGPNGLEIRLTREGTEDAYIAAGAFGGAAAETTEIGASAAATLAKFGPIMQRLLRSGLDLPRWAAKGSTTAAGAYAGKQVDQAIIPDGMCVGITVRPIQAAVGKIGPMEFIGSTGSSGPITSTTWLEPCS